MSDAAQRRNADADHQPDYRFTFANERTFLAWIRTALALDAAGLGAVQLLPPFAVRGAREALGTVLIALGAASAASAVRRWERYQRALEEGGPLPNARLPGVLAVGVTTVSVIVGLFVVASFVAGL